MRWTPSCLPEPSGRHPILPLLLLPLLLLPLARSLAGVPRFSVGAALRRRPAALHPAPSSSLFISLFSYHMCHSAPSPPSLLSRM